MLITRSATDCLAPSSIRRLRRYLEPNTQGRNQKLISEVCSPDCRLFTSFPISLPSLSPLSFPRLEVASQIRLRDLEKRC